MINDQNLTRSLALKMSHPLLAKMHDVLLKVKNALMTTPYTDDVKGIIRTIEQVYVKTANGTFESSASEGTNDEKLSAKKRRALETASLGINPRSLTAISSADGAKILQNIDNLILKYKNSSTQPKTFVGEMADALDVDMKDKSSKYANFECKNGNVVTIRISDHNATSSNLDINGQDNAISIVVTNKNNIGIINDGNAHIVEYYYNAIKLRKAEGKPLADIVGAIKQALYSGEFKDPTGLAERQEVNMPNSDENVLYSLRQKPEPEKKGIGYKVFVLGKDGKLYPPMVANPNGAATPVGVWLDADAAPVAGESKTGRPQVKQGGKGTQGGSGKLAYRPGWHLGVIPYAIQFNRKDAEGNKTLFPKNFVFAEVEYAADKDYQDEAHAEGINGNGKYQHSLAGLKHLPTDGYYMYRTNPNPETDPWVITGAMKVNRLLTRAEQADIVRKAGREPQKIQEGDIVTDDVVNSINQEIAAAPKFSVKSNVDNQGNPLNQDGTLKLDKIKSVDDLTDEDFTNATRNVQLPTVPQNVDAAIGANGKPVIIKKNIFEKNWNAHKFTPAESRKVLSEALYNTDLVGRSQPTKKPNHWVAIKLDEKSPITVLEVNDNKDNVEVVGWYTLDERNLGRIKRQAERNGGELIMLSPNDKVESLSTPSLNSAANVDNSSETSKQNGEKFSLRLQNAISETDIEPTEAQKKSGNYKKGHVKFGGYDYTIENPKGSYRSGVDENGKEWKQKMNDTYGYIRGKFGKDGDHLDMFINDNADLDNWNGDVYVVDQVNPDGKFDEHKVMYGYDSLEEAKKAYLSNYEKGWTGLGNITPVSKADFDKWLDKSNRKLKPFADYADITSKTNMDTAPSSFEEFLEHPAVRYSIRNEKERAAAEDAYNFAQENRPDRYSRYAIVNMEKPGAVPQYLEKKAVADNWRRYYNKLKWGNYKLFDLDKPFEDNVKNLVGKFPETFRQGNDERFSLIGKKGAEALDHAEEVSTRLDNLNVARQMEGAKKDVKAIKMATGWERGADGKWRYEIADSKLNDMMDVDGKGKMVKRHKEDMLWTSGKLGEVVVAPELFKAYPKLKDVRLETDSIMNNLPSNGEYNAKTNTITIHADELKYLDSILNHEIQHVIQDLEGFAQGGDSKHIRKVLERMINENQEASDYAKDKLKEWVTLTMAADRLSDLYKQYINSDNEWLKNKAIESYWDAMNELDNNEQSTLTNDYPDGTAREIAESGYHVDEAEKELRRLAKETKESIPEGNNSALDLVSKLTDALENNDDYNLYRKLGGEVEARNVQSRMGMSPEERRKTLAEETEDVARKDQIFLYGGSVSMMGSRAFNEAINSSDNIRFSLKSMMEKPEGWKQANKKAIHIAEAIERDPKFSLKNLDGTLIKAGTYFSGGGLVEEGLKGIIDPVVAVEYDEKISGVYRNNFGNHIVTADVRDVDPKELVGKIDGEVEYFHASPVCKNYSLAKNNHEELELDKETAASTAEFISKVRPKVVTIENVKGYKDSEAMKTITDALDEAGYKWDADVYNAADYGGYTNRERLIVRAVRDGELPAKPEKQKRKSGWYEAVEDIMPTLTEKKNGVAPWMDERLKADGIDWRHIDKPLYVMGSGYANGTVPHAFADELLPTLRTKSGDVIVMPDGKVYRAMGRVLARVSGVSDDYQMPASEALSHTIIGNGIPTQLTENVIAPLVRDVLHPAVEEKASLKDADRKQTQLDIILKTNPMLDDYHTGIRKVEDIKTLGESVEEARSEAEKYGDDEWSAYPDITNDMLQNALETGEITIYSSKPIKNGVFVTPSYMQASDYAGGGNVYEKTVPLTDVAWINTDEGQYAKVDGERYSLKEVNDKFNDRLAQLIENPNQKDRVLHLGRSSQFLIPVGGINLVHT